MALLDQLGDQLEHLRDVAGGGRLVGRRGDVERVVGLVELALHRVGEVVPGPALLGRLDQDLVVDVGDVADERDVVAAVAQPALQHVEVHRRPDVPDVRLRLHGQAADVETRLPLLEGHEVTDLAGLGVVEPEHRPSLGRRRAPPQIPCRGSSQVRGSMKERSDLRAERARPAIGPAATMGRRSRRAPAREASAPRDRSRWPWRLRSLRAQRASPWARGRAREGRQPASCRRGLGAEARGGIQSGSSATFPKKSSICRTTSANWSKSTGLETWTDACRS